MVPGPGQDQGPRQGPCQGRLEPTRRGRSKGRCDACSADVPSAMVVCRCGLVLSPTRRGRNKGCCDVCSAGVPPAMVVYRCGLFLSLTDTDTAPVPVAAGGPDPALNAGLLARRDAHASRRPSVAPSAWSRVGSVEGCDHADGTPAACHIAGRTDFIAFAKRPPAAATRPHERTTVGKRGPAVVCHARAPLPRPGSSGEPGRHLCKAGRSAEGSFRHKCGPGTPMEARSAGPVAPPGFLDSIERGMGACAPLPWRTG